MFNLQPNEHLLVSLNAIQDVFAAEQREIHAEMEDRLTRLQEQHQRERLATQTKHHAAAELYKWGAGAATQLSSEEYSAALDAAASVKK
jgi:hypothetical protein